MVSFGTTRDYVIIAMFCDRNSGDVMRAKVMWNPLHNYAGRYSHDAIALTEMAIGITSAEKDALWGDAQNHSRNHSYYLCLLHHHYHPRNYLLFVVVALKIVEKKS